MAKKYVEIASQDLAFDMTVRVIMKILAGSPEGTPAEVYEGTVQDLFRQQGIVIIRTAKKDVNVVTKDVERLEKVEEVADENVATPPPIPVPPAAREAVPVARLDAPAAPEPELPEELREPEPPASEPEPEQGQVRQPRKSNRAIRGLGIGLGILAVLLALIVLFGFLINMANGNKITALVTTPIPAAATTAASAVGPTFMVDLEQVSKRCYKTAEGRLTLTDCQKLSASH